MNSLFARKNGYRIKRKYHPVPSADAGFMGLSLTWIPKKPKSSDWKRKRWRMVSGIRRRRRRIS
jgi:hypothetical protein